jgi:hypothetical protein
MYLGFRCAPDQYQRIKIGPGVKNHNGLDPCCHLPIYPIVGVETLVR